jgi:N-acetylglucosaminyldiphosphoundecaprenol N-acetyl-beta-D-mannosaminyltransferase
METLRYLTTENSTGEPKERMCFLGLRFDTGSMETATRDILTEAGGRFRYVVTPNVHHMVRLLEDPATLRPLYERAWRVFCDSRVLSRLARASGLQVPVITGSDLTFHLITHAAKQGLKIAVIGSSDAACAKLRQKYAGLSVVSHSPPMGFIRSELEVRKCVDFVLRAQAPLVFLAVGRPQQEILASRIADHPQARGVGLCIGASIDFLTGAQMRAPVWIQKAGLEWFFRLVSDPQRFARRYLLESPWIFYFVFLEFEKNMTRLNLGELKLKLSVKDRHAWTEAFARRELPRSAPESESDLAPAATLKANNVP